MLYNCQAFKNWIKLRAVANHFPCILKLWTIGDIESIYRDVSTIWLHNACKAFEACCLTCSWYSQQRKAFSIVKTKGNIVNSYCFSISLYTIFKSNWHIFWTIFDSITLLLDIIISTLNSIGLFKKWLNIGSWVFLNNILSISCWPSSTAKYLHLDQHN